MSSFILIQLSKNIKETFFIINQIVIKILEEYAEGGFIS
jgi:hypothetical protein